MRFEGNLKSWNDERGFGFIEPTLGGQEIFLHIKALPRGTARPQINQRLSFEVEIGPQGKKRAKNVELARVSRRAPRPERQKQASRGTGTLLILPAFLVLYLVVTVLWQPPVWILGAYVVASLITFGSYAADKAAAESGAWRTSENTLHFLALAGGWPGALLAQQVLRHKSRKAEFRRVFWLTIVVNVLGFLFVCSPSGQVYWLAP